MTPLGYRATAFVLFRPLSAALRGVVNTLIFNLIYIFISFISFLPLISLIVTDYLCLSVASVGGYLSCFCGQNQFGIKSILIFSKKS